MKEDRIVFFFLNPRLKAKKVSSIVIELTHYVVHLVRTRSN